MKKKQKKSLTSRAKLKPKQIKTYLSAQKLKTFKKLLIARKQFLLSTLSQLEEKTLSQSTKEAAGNLSNFPIHIADIGTDTYEQNLSLGLIESESEEIQQINEALDRIETKTYGLCESCSQPIPEKRLQIIPYARLCIKCKSEEEKRG